MRGPDAPRGFDLDVLHGVAVADPYRWLEDAHDARTRAWLAGHRDLYAQTRAAWPHLDRWSRGLTDAMAPERSSAPVVRRTREFFVRATKDSEHPVLFTRENGVDRILLDPLAIDTSGDTVLEDWQPSHEGDLLAYQLSAHGDEDCVLAVRDVATGRVVDGPIDRVRRTGIAWLPGATHYYYVRRLAPQQPGDKLYHRRIYLHRIGADPAEDVVIFGDGRAAASFYGLSITSDGRWLTISATDGTSPHNELWIADLRHGDPAHPRLRPIQAEAVARTHTRIAPGTAASGTMWLRTTLSAPRGRVVATTPGEPGPSRWRTLIGERDDAVLRDFVALTGERLPRPLALASWLRHAVSEITVHDLADGTQLSEVKLPGAGSAGFFHTYPWRGHEVWFHYTDHATPSALLRFDALGGRLSADQPRPAGQDAPRVTIETATANDGTPVRIFVISPAGAPDHPRPTILNGYGGFGAPMTPHHSPDIEAWVRAGGVFAVACLRGGGEEGAEWHRAGQGRSKQRVFDDFDAVTDHLVRRGWTTTRQLGILGSSNGGLLVAAALTQHPEKYAAAVCLAPLTDMIRYERSGMGPSWRPEYGTVDDPDDFAALRAYSPYHHVREGAPYPPVLIGAFEADSRVDPAHARKFAAALQHASPSPVILRAERNVGHGNRSTSRTIAVLAEVLAFFGHYLGLHLDER
jgi:prolyl oligopeptidase